MCIVHVQCRSSLRFSLNGGPAVAARCCQGLRPGCQEEGVQGVHGLTAEGGQGAGAGLIIIFTVITNNYDVIAWREFWNKIHLITYGFDSGTQLLSQQKLLSYGELTVAGEKLLA